MSDILDRAVFNLPPCPFCGAEAHQNIPAERWRPVVQGKWVEYERAHYFKCSVCKETGPYKKAALINGKRSYNFCRQPEGEADG